MSPLICLVSRLVPCLSEMPFAGSLRSRVHLVDTFIESNLQLVITQTSIVSSLGLTAFLKSTSVWPGRTEPVALHFSL